MTVAQSNNNGQNSALGKRLNKAGGMLVSGASGIVHGSGGGSAVELFNLAGNLVLQVTGLSEIDALKTALGEAQRIISNSVNIYSSLVERQNVIDVTFKGSAAAVDAWAKACKESYGVAELSAKQAVGNIGALMSSAGMSLSGVQKMIGQMKNGDSSILNQLIDKNDVQDTDALIAQMSTSLAGLAGDIASFYDISFDEAWTRIRSGLSGMVVPLRNIGIDISATSMQAYAAAQGIDKTFKSMTQAEKVALRYQYLMEVTSNVQGDFVRTSESYNNQVRLLEQEWQEMYVHLGELMYPMAQGFQKTITGMMGDLNEALWGNSWDRQLKEAADKYGETIQSSLREYERVNSLLNQYDAIMESGEADSEKGKVQIKEITDQLISVEGSYGDVIDKTTGLLNTETTAIRENARAKQEAAQHNAEMDYIATLRQIRDKAETESFAAQVAYGATKNIIATGTSDEAIEARRILSQYAFSTLNGIDDMNDESIDFYRGYGWINDDNTVNWEKVAEDHSETFQNDHGQTNRLITDLGSGYKTLTAATAAAEEANASFQERLAFMGYDAETLQKLNEQAEETTNTLTASVTHSVEDLESAQKALDDALKAEVNYLEKIQEEAMKVTKSLVSGFEYIDEASMKAATSLAEQARGYESQVRYYAHVSEQIQRAQTNLIAAGASEEQAIGMVNNLIATNDIATLNAIANAAMSGDEQMQQFGFTINEVDGSIVKLAESTAKLEFTQENVMKAFSDVKTAAAEMQKYYDSTKKSADSLAASMSKGFTPFNVKDKANIKKARAALESQQQGMDNFKEYYEQSVANIMNAGGEDAYTEEEVRSTLGKMILEMGADAYQYLNMFAHSKNAADTTATFDLMSHKYEHQGELSDWITEEFLQYDEKWQELNDDLNTKVSALGEYGELAERAMKGVIEGMVKGLTSEADVTALNETLEGYETLLNSAFQINDIGDVEAYVTQYLSLGQAQQGFADQYAASVLKVDEEYKKLHEATVKAAGEFQKLTEGADEITKAWADGLVAGLSAGLKPFQESVDKYTDYVKQAKEIVAGLTIEDDGEGQGTFNAGTLEDQMKRNMIQKGKLRGKEAAILGVAERPEDISYFGLVGKHASLDHQKAQAARFAPELEAPRFVPLAGQASIEHQRAQAARFAPELEAQQIHEVAAEILANDAEIAAYAAEQAQMLEYIRGQARGRLAEYRTANAGEQGPQLLQAGTFSMSEAFDNILRGKKRANEWYKSQRIDTAEVETFTGDYGDSQAEFNEFNDLYRTPSEEWTYQDVEDRYNADAERVEELQAKIAAAALEADNYRAAFEASGFGEDMLANAEGRKAVLEEELSVVEEEMRAIEEGEIDASNAAETLGSKASDALTELQNIATTMENIDGSSVNIDVNLNDNTGGKADISSLIEAGQQRRGHATGLNYVPYNEYPAMLHEGEAVLTKLEARDWRNGSSQGRTDTQALAAAISSSIITALSGMQVTMDRKAVGTMVASTVDEQIGRTARQRRW